MAKVEKKRASRQEYQSQYQLVIPGFETPFEKNLDPSNRWVVLSKSIPWDRIVNVYLRSMSNSNYGTSNINARMIIGAMIIKHYMGYTDRETIDMIKENVYMQYFVGLSSFTHDRIFDASLFVTIRKRLEQKAANEINEIVVKYWNEQKEEIAQEENQNQKETQGKESKTIKDQEGQSGEMQDKNPEDKAQEKRGEKIEEEQEEEPHLEGTLIIDATACPQGITYPTDIKLLNECREHLESMIDSFHEYFVKRQTEEKVIKPRTYREEARKEYLKIAQNKNPGYKKIKKGVRKQLNYIKRNLKHIDKYLTEVKIGSVLSAKQHNYLLRIDQIYAQQLEMYEERKHQVNDRIVNLHQPYVRPIVRGKMPNKVEFGAKIQLAITDKGMCYLDHISWDAFNEGQYLIDSVEKYKTRHGYYPKEVLADKIYCNKANRAWLKFKQIKLKAKPLGRPKALSSHVSPGERNPIEGKIGQAKLAYGLNRIQARLSTTSKSWIASIILVLNLVKLAGLSAYCQFSTLIFASIYPKIHYNLNQN